MTPSQHSFHKQRKQRHARFAEAAARHVPAASKVRPYQPTWSMPVFSAPESVEQWVQRQKQIPLPVTKELWFRIVDEIDLVPAPVRIESIQRATSSHYGVSVLDISSFRRTANVVRPRQVAMYLAKTLTLRSLPEIGRRFGGRDHTTVLHAVRKIERLVAIDPDLATRIEQIKAAIEADHATQRTDSTSEAGLSIGSGEIAPEGPEASRACDADGQVIEAGKPQGPA